MAAAPASAAHVEVSMPARPDAPKWSSLVIGVVGIVSGGLGSLAAFSYASGVQAREIQALRSEVEDHKQQPAHSGSISEQRRVAERLASIEATLVGLREGVARVEQSLRDDRSERRGSGQR